MSIPNGIEPGLSDTDRALWEAWQAVKEPRP